MPITLINVSKRYTNDSPILDSANLTINDNSFVALIGKSGSGKSTLLNLISGLDRPDSGDIQIDGKSIINMSDNNLSIFRNDNIGFVFQFFYLQPFLSVAENIAAASYPNENITKDMQEQRASRLIKAVGLDGKSNAQPKTLSGGEMQRVAIARAMMNLPKIILADEPTGNLDTENSQNVIQLLRTIQKKTSCILIIVTHDQSISKLADRVIKISEGKFTDAA